MSTSATCGTHKVVSAVTTWTEVTFGIRPSRISVQAGTVDAYLRTADGVDGAALGTDYWLIPAGNTHDFDISGNGGAINIAAASASSVYLWSAR